MKWYNLLALVMMFVNVIRFGDSVADRYYNIGYQRGKIDAYIESMNWRLSNYYYMIQAEADTVMFPAFEWTLKRNAEPIGEFPVIFDPGRNSMGFSNKPE